MRDRRLSVGLRVASAILTVTLLVTNSWAATEKVLYSFNYKDGDFPVSVIFDAAGNLYGMTAYGGSGSCSNGCGTIFELTPKAGGGWMEKVLHSFNGKDGYYPSAGLIFDAAGNLYGPTSGDGGAHFGTAFELTPKAGGGWMEKVLHSFNGKDGAFPYATLIIDASGNLYGTTYGTFGANGTVFELVPRAGGGWTEKVLHSFNYTDGAGPLAGLILDVAGNLYGTTGYGGAYSDGTVFELTFKAGGGWTEHVLHSFNGKDGWGPFAGLIFDASGNLYGTTGGGGAYGYGTVFELTPKAGGGWTEKVLHSFNGKDGYFPSNNLTFDATGNLYGTTSGGGGYFGTVFELTPKAGGGWAEKVLHHFNLDGNDGLYPDSGLIFDASGNLYGTTGNGGAYGNGTVFEITP